MINLQDSLREETQAHNIRLVHSLYFKCVSDSGLEELILIKNSMLKNYRIQSVELKQGEDFE